MFLLSWIDEEGVGRQAGIRRRRRRRSRLQKKVLRLRLRTSRYIHIHKAIVNGGLPTAVIITITLFHPIDLDIALYTRVS